MCIIQTKPNIQYNVIWYCLLWTFGIYWKDVPTVCIKISAHIFLFGSNYNVHFIIDYRH